MKKVFALLVILVVTAAWAARPAAISAASSDDFANYTKRDPEDYNFLPLVLDPSKSTGSTSALRDTISYNMVYDQGYEAQCAKPDWNISSQLYGALREYFEVDGAPITLNSTATYNVDFSTGKIPLFRGDEALDSTNKISSFEGYFGANNLQKTPAETNSTGVANLLLSTDTQCAAKYANLQSLFADGALCSKLADPGQCALSRPITGANMTTEELYEQLTSLFSRQNSDGRRLSCGDITGGWNEELGDFGFTQSTFNTQVAPTVDALQKAPLNLDILYRLAFLVIAPRQNTMTGGDDVFSFLQSRSPLPNQTNHAPLSQDRHAPIIVGFKVPFTATNTIYSLPNLREASTLTAQALHEYAGNTKNTTDEEASRSAFLQRIIENKNSKPLVNCDGMPQCTGGNDQALYQALIDIVNGSNLACSDFKGPYENAGDLGSPAAVSEDKEYQLPYYSRVIPTTNTAGFTWSLRVNDITSGATAAQDKVPVSAYLITPYGTNLEYIQNALQTRFGQDQLAKLIEENCIEDFNGECGLAPEYFTLGGILADLDSDEASHTFQYWADANPDCLTNTGANPNCRQLSFGADISEQPRDPLRILGAGVGWLIQKAQEAFREVDSIAARYIKECKRTEDLFLGRCLGFLGKPGGSDSQVANSCNDYRGIEVQLPNGFEGLRQTVCSVANNNAQDAQLLWGLTQIDGYPMNTAIGQGKTSIPCSDLIINSCGASQIVGIIVPQCANAQACPGSAFALGDGAASQAYRDSITTEVACSVEGALRYILQLRKSEAAELRAAYRAANGSDPSSQQLYYMMAGRNYGLPMNQLTQPGCAGAPAVSGCSGANYCQCVMDTFKQSC